jgi:hypothetical protein
MHPGNKSVANIKTGAIGTVSVPTEMLGSVFDWSMRANIQERVGPLAERSSVPHGLHKPVICQKASSIFATPPRLRQSDLKCDVAFCCVRAGVSEHETTLNQLF